MTELAFLYALIPLFGWGIADAIAHSPAARVKPIVLVTMQSVVTFAIILCAWLLMGSVTSFSLDLLYPFVAGIAGGLGFLAFITSLKGGKVGISTAISNSFPIFTTIFGIAVLGEALSLPIVFAIGTIVAGVFLMTFKLDDWRGSDIFSPENKVQYAFVALLLWTLFNILLKISTNTIPPLTVTLLTEMGALVTALIIFLYAGYSLTSIKAVSKKDRITIGIIGAFLAAAILGMIKAYSVGSLGVASGVIGAMPLVTAIVAYLFLHERMTKQEWIAACIVGIGLVSLGYFSIG